MTLKQENIRHRERSNFQLGSEEKLHFDSRTILTQYRSGHRSAFGVSPCQT